MKRTMRRLSCPWCDWYILWPVLQDSLPSATHIAWRHAEDQHGVSWDEFSEALADDDEEAA